MYLYRRIYKRIENEDARETSIRFGCQMKPGRNSLNRLLSIISNYKWSAVIKPVNTCYQAEVLVPVQNRDST